MDIEKQLQETIDFIHQKWSHEPQIAMVLGSGLNFFQQQLTNAVTFDYADIPHFPVTTVKGHKGQLTLGELEGKKLALMCGRFHYYEGYSLQEVIFPVRMMGKLGAKTLIVTNAAGGVNKSFNVGELMLITDHLNLLGTNPLIGPNIDFLGTRFPDMTNAYTKQLCQLAKEVANEQDVKLNEGTYMCISGPSFETPAEIHMMRVLGADAVGMSTVPEVIAARHMGLEVLGISCITNMAAGVLDQPLSHEEVFTTANSIQPSFNKLLTQIISKMDK